MLRWLCLLLISVTIWTAAGQEAVEAPQCGPGEDPAQCGILQGKTECGVDFARTWSRVVVVADVHGDAKQLRRALRLASILSQSSDEWIGETAVFVQTGDVVDRGPDSLEIYQLLRSLREQAIAAGGCVLQLLGNHEVLNLAGDFSYADPKETRNFGGLSKRRAAFGLGHWLGKYLRGLPLVARVIQEVSGSSFTTILSHAGMPPGLAESKAVEAINREVRGMLEGAAEEQVRKLAYTNHVLLGQGPLWTRIFAHPDEQLVCRTLERSLRAMGPAQRMIVGHTVQETGRPSVRCRGQLVLADTGMSALYGGGLSLVQLEPEPGSPILLYDP